MPSMYTEVATQKQSLESFSRQVSTVYWKFTSGSIPFLYYDLGHHCSNHSNVAICQALEYAQHDRLPKILNESKGSTCYDCEEFLESTT